jgi:hypothetical protein
MVALRVSIWLLLTTSIVGLAGGALAAGKIKLAQTSNVTICMMNCNSQKALCQSTCATSPKLLPPCLVNWALAPVMLLQADRASRVAPTYNYNVK